MSLAESTSRVLADEPIGETLMIQWQAGMERLKHFEALVATGLGLYLAALAYAVSKVLAETQNPTEHEYWAVVFVLTVLCLCQLHVVDRVNDAAAGVIELEVASRGALTYMSNVGRRITWTASFGFLTAFVTPAVSVLGIMFEYRSLASNRYYPLIVMGLSSLIFLAFAWTLLHRQREIVESIRAQEK